MEKYMPQQVSLRHPSILDLYHFSLDCFESCSQNPDALSITATGNTKWIEAARAGCFRKTRKRHRSKQQQFLSSNSTCSQIGTSCSLAVSSNSHHCHSATTAALPFLLLLATNFVLFFFLFASSFMGTSGSFPENLRHLDEQLIFSDAVFLLSQLLLLCSIRPEVPLSLEKVLRHCTAAFDRLTDISENSSLATIICFFACLFSHNFAWVTSKCG